MSGPHEEWVEPAPPPAAVLAELESAGAEPESEPVVDAEAPVEAVQISPGHRHNEVGRCTLCDISPFFEAIYPTQLVAQAKARSQVYK